MSKQIALEGFLSEIYPLEYATMEGMSLISENEKIAIEGVIGEKVKGIIDKFVAWIQRLVSAIRTKISNLFSKIATSRKAIAAIDVVPHGLEELAKPALGAFEDTNKIPAELDKITQFTDTALNQFRTGHFHVDWGSFVKTTEQCNTAASNCREYVEKINGWRSSGKFENESAAPSSIPKQIAKSMDECQAIIKKINDKIGTIKLLTNPSEIAHIAQNAGLEDRENDKYVVDFTNVMIRVYNTLPAMLHYTEAVIAIGNAFLFAYNAWKAENGKNVKTAQKAAYKSGYRAESDDAK